MVAELLIGGHMPSISHIVQEYLTGDWF